MSVLMHFAMFPTDKGASVSNEVSLILKMLETSGINYKLGSMGTTIETENFDQALQILQKSYEIIEKHSERIYASINFDIRKGNNNDRMNKKIESIELKIGKVNQ